VAHTCAPASSAKKRLDHGRHDAPHFKLNAFAGNDVFVSRTRGFELHESALFVQATTRQLALNRGDDDVAMLGLEGTVQFVAAVGAIAAHGGAIGKGFAANHRCIIGLSPSGRRQCGSRFSLLGVGATCFLRLAGGSLQLRRDGSSLTRRPQP